MVSAYALTIIVIYLVGLLFVSGKTPLSDTAQRLAIGLLLSVCILGFFHAGFGTMLIAFTPFFLMVLRHRVLNHKAWWKVDFRKTHLLHLGVVLVLAVTVFVHEAERYDLRKGNDFIYVGNTDISFYSAHGQMMYHFGEETLASSASDNSQKVLYHYADLWVSGFYSHYLGFTPYYAYGIVYRSLGITLLLVVFFALFQPMVGNLLGVVGALLVLLLNNSFVSGFAISSVDLFTPFGSNWPIYAESSYLLCGIAMGFFGLMMKENRLHYTALIGFMLFGAIHSSFVVPGFLMGLFIVFVKLVYPRLFEHAGLPAGWIRVIALSLAGILPYIYVVLDHRGFPVHLEDFGQLAYLSVHTAIRVGWTLLLSLPLWVGATYLIWKKDSRKSGYFLTYAFIGILGFAYCLQYFSL